MGLEVGNFQISGIGADFFLLLVSILILLMAGERILYDFSPFTFMARC